MPVQISKYLIFNYSSIYIDCKVLYPLPSAYFHKSQNYPSSIIHLFAHILKYFILCHLSTCIDFKVLLSSPSFQFPLELEPHVRRVVIEFYKY